MATGAVLNDKAKRIRFYHNGDRSNVKTVCINRTIKTWDVLLEELTNKLKLSLPARRVHTPGGGTSVNALDTLSDEKDYVVVSNGRFRKLDYNLPDTSNLRKPFGHYGISPRMLLEIKPVAHSRVQAPGRIHKVPNKVITILCYNNGDELQPARRMAFNDRALKNWRFIMDELTDKLQMAKPCVKLYTDDYQLVTSPNQLQVNATYIAVGAGQPLKKMHYGRPPPKFNNSKLVQNRQLEPIKRYRSRRGTHDSSPTSTSTRKTDKSISTQGSRATRHSKGSRGRESDGVFHAKPVKHTPGTRGPRREEVGPFKKSGNRSEGDDADEVQETLDTKVDLPIDQVEAEEVAEEEYLTPTNEKDILLPHNKNLTKSPSSESDNIDRQSDYDEEEEEHMSTIHSETENESDSHSPNNAKDNVSKFRTTAKIITKVQQKQQPRRNVKKK